MRRDPQNQETVSPKETHPASVEAEDTAMTKVQERYQVALDALVARLKQDRYVLAAILYGSVARGEAWERSDIDLTIIQRDGLEREVRFLWLVEDGIHIAAEVISRNRFKRIVEGVLQGSIGHSIHSQSKLLFSKDESIAAWLNQTSRVGSRDQSFQLLRQLAEVPFYLDKAEKWFHVKSDPTYSFLWIMDAVRNLARVEVLLNGEAPEREVMHQAIKYNPSFFSVVYTDLINEPKTGHAIRRALGLIDAYLEERVDQLFKPVLDYLAKADGIRTISELNEHLDNKVQGASAMYFYIYDWLARKGFIERAAAPVRLTRKSRVTLEEPAYYYDPGLYDEEETQ